MPSADGNNGDCLVTDSSGGLSFQSCTGGAGGGVTSINSQTGVVTIANSSGFGGVVTIQDASTAQKGLAQFNSTNFSGSGTINTIQDIAVTATPTFSSLTLTTALTVANGGTGASSLTANGVLLGNGASPVTAVTGSLGQCLVATAGAPVFQACPGSGGVTSVEGQTGVVTVNNSTGSGGAITIDNAKADDGTTPGIASFSSTNFSDNGAGVISIKSGGVTTSEIANGTIANADLAGGTYAAITGTGALAAGSLASGFGTISTTNSISTTAALQGATASLTGASSLTLGTAATNTGSIKFYNNTLGSTGSITLDASDPVAANYAIHLPAENGTICLQSSANCNFAPSSGGSGYVQLQGSTPGTAQSGNLNITGTAIADILQGTSHVYTPDLDRASAGTLTIGGTNASTITIANNAAAHTINIGTGAAVQSVTLGSLDTTSGTAIQGGSGGIGFHVNSGGSFGYYINGTSVETIDTNGRVVFQNLSNASTSFAVNNATGSTLLAVDPSANETLIANGLFRVSVVSGIQDDSSLNFTGNNNAVAYTTPNGTSPFNSKIALQNYSMGAFNALMFGGILNSDSPNARGITLFDQRGYNGVTYTPTNLMPAINLISPGEDANFGLSWDGSDCTSSTTCIAKLKTTGASGNASIAIAPNDTPYLKVFENGGVGIGATAAAGTSQNEVVRIQGASYPSTAGFGNNSSNVLDAIGTDGQTTTGTTGQTAGYGGGILLQAGNGGDAPSGSSNGNGGDVRLSAGAAGVGAGTAATAGSVVVNNVSNSTAAFQVQNTSNNAIFTVDTSNAQIVVGKSGSLSGKISFRDNSNANSITLQAATQTVGSANITIPDVAGVSDTVCLLTLANCLGGGTGGANTTLSNLSGPTAINTDLTFASGASRAVTVGQAASGNNGNQLTVSAGGGNGTDKNGGNLVLTGGTPTGTGTSSIVVKSNTNDSTSAFQIQNAAGTTALLTADTTNQRISVGSGGTATGQLYVSGSAPTSAVGSIALSAQNRGLYKMGNYLYAVNNTTGKLYIVDEFDPANPTLMNSGGTATGIGANAVYVQGHYAYITGNGANNLVIMDVSKPSAPVITASLALAGTGQSIYVQGKYAYVPSYTSPYELQAIDVSNPANPFVAGSVASTCTVPYSGLRPGQVRLCRLCRQRLRHLRRIQPGQHLPGQRYGCRCHHQPGKPLRPGPLRLPGGCGCV